MRRLINARFHPARVPLPLSSCVRSVSLEKLSPSARGLGGPLHYPDPKQRSIDGYRERFWCIVQPFEAGSRLRFRWLFSVAAAI